MLDIGWRFALAGLLVLGGVSSAQAEWQLKEGEGRGGRYVRAFSGVADGWLALNCSISDDGTATLGAYNKVNEKVFSPLYSQFVEYRIDGQLKGEKNWVRVDDRLSLVGAESHQDILHFTADLAMGSSLTLDYLAAIPSQTYLLTGSQAILAEVLSACGEDPEVVFAKQAGSITSETYVLAEQIYGLQNYSRAEELFAEVLADPTISNATRRLAREFWCESVLYQSPIHARTMLQIRVAEEPGNADYLYAYATALVLNNDLELAQKMVQRLDHIYGEDNQYSLTVLADIAYLQRDYGTAQHYYEVIAMRDDDVFEPMARLTARLNNKDTALPRFTGPPATMPELLNMICQDTPAKQIFSLADSLHDVRAEDVGNIFFFLGEMARRDHDLIAAQSYLRQARHLLLPQARYYPFVAQSLHELSGDGWKLANLPEANWPPYADEKQAILAFKKHDTSADRHSLAMIRAKHAARLMAKYTRYQDPDDLRRAYVYAETAAVLARSNFYYWKLYGSIAYQLRDVNYCFIASHSGFTRAAQLKPDDQESQMMVIQLAHEMQAPKLTFAPYEALAKYHTRFFIDHYLAMVINDFIVAAPLRGATMLRSLPDDFSTDANVILAYAILMRAGGQQDNAMKVMTLLEEFSATIDPELHGIVRRYQHHWEN